MSLYEPETPKPAPAAEPEQPEYDDAACMSECQRLMELIGQDFGKQLAYVEGQVNTLQLAPLMEVRGLWRVLFAAGICTPEQRTAAMHLELRDMLRRMLTDLEAQRDTPKKPQIALPGGGPGLVLPNGRPIKH